MDRPIDFVDLEAEHDDVADDLQARLQAVVDETDFILGDAVATFEEAWADFVGADHAVGVGCGLDALSLTLRALGVGPGDEVLVPANTFIATALAVSEVGADPVLVETDPDTYNVDLEALEEQVTDRTAAVMPVHLTGLPADMAPIMEVAEAHDVPVVEDAAQAHGATYKGTPCGSMGRAGCFSFYPSKNLGAYGDAGAVTTDDPDLARDLRELRDYGRRDGDHVRQGKNTRLDSLQAAVLNAKLPELADWNEARRRAARRYHDRLADLDGLDLQAVPHDRTHVYHLYVVRTDRRDALQDHLSEADIDTGIHYEEPVHLHEAYADHPASQGDHPTAERYARRCLSLPMHPHLTADEVDAVVDAVAAFAKAR